MDDAWAEIDSLHHEGVPPWEFIFNAKDHELPDDEDDLDQFRLKRSELKELGRHVTSLRE